MAWKIGLARGYRRQQTSVPPTGGIIQVWHPAVAVEHGTMGQVARARSHHPPRDHLPIAFRVGAAMVTRPTPLGRAVGAGGVVERDIFSIRLGQIHLNSGSPPASKRLVFRDIAHGDSTPA